MAWSWAPSDFDYPVQNNALYFGGRGTGQQPRQFQNVPLSELLGLPVPVPVHTRNFNNNVQHRNQPRQYYEPRGQFQLRYFPAPHYNNHRNRPQNRPLLNNPYSHENRQPRFTQNTRNPVSVGNPRNPTSVGNPRNPTSVGNPAQGTNSRWEQEWQRVENMNLVRSVFIKHDPFYDVHDTVLQNIIMKKSSEQMQLTFKFNLSPDQLENLRTDDTYQVQLRFCKLDTMREQPDYFPNSLQVAVNSDLLHIKGLHEVPKGPAEPIDITRFCYLAQQTTNEIHIRTFEECKMYVFIVKKLTSSDLIQRLKDAPHSVPAITSEKIKEKLSQDTSLEEIAPTTLQCSLLCPLGRTRLKLPCRAWTCKHLQCFDAATYIQMNEQKPKWCCPVCRESAQYKNLYIDGYFLNVLEENTTDDTIVLLADGSWKPMNLADQELDQVGKAPERIQLEENTALPMTEKTINLESDDEVCAENNSCEDNKDSNVASALSSTVETITLSDDEPSDPESPQITRTSFRFCSTPMSSQTSDRESNNEIQSSGPRTRGRTSQLLNNSEVSDISSTFEDTTFEQSRNTSDDSFLPLSVSNPQRIFPERTRKRKAKRQTGRRALKRLLREKEGQWKSPRVTRQKSQPKRGKRVQ
ncbi:E3 SUMO-protein ligase PIAS2-like [Penaeus monodon]|uniref:E3 SUMO-protein ligase PIAS2-like n=1 Tax=Penaeus monodon TaxID=6687 RepID=UPI0018A721E6|nr:E3 SUMO-protein ligase PIAS2-like [Penaeus monodon]